MNWLIEPGQGTDRHYLQMGRTNSGCRGILGKTKVLEYAANSILRSLNQLWWAVFLNKKIGVRKVYGSEKCGSNQSKLV